MLIIAPRVPCQALEVEFFVNPEHRVRDISEWDPRKENGCALGGYLEDKAGTTGLELSL